MTIFQGQKLRDARVAAGLTQQRLAKALGVSQERLFDGDES
jgi:transcriptional regulator with XRE-family HTH domain